MSPLAAQLVTYAVWLGQLAMWTLVVIGVANAYARTRRIGFCLATVGAAGLLLLALTSFLLYNPQFGFLSFEARMRAAPSSSGATYTSIMPSQETLIAIRYTTAGLGLTFQILFGLGLLLGCLAMRGAASKGFAPEPGAASQNFGGPTNIYAPQHAIRQQPPRPAPPPPPPPQVRG